MRGGCAQTARRPGTEGVPGRRRFPSGVVLGGHRGGDLGRDVPHRRVPGAQTGPCRQQGADVPEGVEGRAMGDGDDPVGLRLVLEVRRVRGRGPFPPDRPGVAAQLLDVDGERAVVSIIGEGDVDRLVGDNGEVLDALQELTRLAALAETGQRSRLMLDIAGYRARRRAELGQLGRSTAETVAETGEAERLAPMNPFERKVVHDAVGEVDGVSSSSEGEEPNRRVVISRVS